MAEIEKSAQLKMIQILMRQTLANLEASSSHLEEASIRLAVTCLGKRKMVVVTVTITDGMIMVTSLKWVTGLGNLLIE